MFDQRLLDKQLAAIDCSKLSKLSYALPSSNPSLRWSVSFRLLGVYRWEIDGAVKVAHEDATPFAQRCLQQLAGSWWASAVAKHPNIGDGTGCPVANLAPWGSMHSLKIKDLSTAESSERVAADVRTYVLPFVQSVRDEVAYLTLLLSDQEPMKWMFSQPLARFAEAAFVSVRLGKSPEHALAALERERAFAVGQLPGHDLDEYARSVLQAARQECES
ncbi:MAG: hypothetical protein U5L03_16460 [Burkholderiaceae bacterium]|nr:hypothetical protein [Burkholderiaceae bacterium]